MCNLSSIQAGQKNFLWRLIPAVLGLFFLLYGEVLSSPIRTDNCLSSHAAIEKTHQAIKGTGWQIVFLSTVGLRIKDQTYSKDFTKAEEAMMRVDGTAGQWVVDCFKNTPKIRIKKGKKEFVYPLQRLIITVRGIEKVPESTVTSPFKLTPLKTEAINALDDARKLALNQFKSKKIDWITVSSVPDEKGTIKWRYWLFDKNTPRIWGEAVISQDGIRVENTDVLWTKD